MPAIRELSDPSYKNWIKAGLALKYAKDILTDFLRKSIDKFKNETLQENFEKQCTSCTLCNVIPCPTNSFCCLNKGSCTKHNTSNVCKMYNPCPSGVCDKVYTAIKLKYALGGKDPNWKQSNPQQWCSNVWEIAKCFMPVGYEGKHDTQDYDFSGVISLIINSKFIQDDLSQPFHLPFFQKVSLCVYSI